MKKQMNEIIYVSQEELYRKATNYLEKYASGILP
jgi:hypothetical protein